MNGSSDAMENTHIWFCQRHEEVWSGGLVIFAKNKRDAGSIFVTKEGHTPEKIRELLPNANGVLYDDYER